MITYTPSTPVSYDPAVPLVDTTDPVQGGLTGASNASPKKNADNIQWLYDRMCNFQGSLLLDSTQGTVGVSPSTLGSDTRIFTPGGSTMRNKVTVICNTDGRNSQITLPSAGFKAGDRLLIVNESAQICALRPGSMPLIGNYGSISGYLYLYPNETIELVVNSTNVTLWIINIAGGVERVGEVGLVMAQPARTLRRIGQVVNRKDYPRLWDWVYSNFDSTPTLVDDTTWASDPGSDGFYPYKGCFSTGDGSTTFRLPDHRGLFERALSLGDNLRDQDRHTAGVGSNVGDLQKDAFRTHSHNVDVAIGSGTIGSFDPGIGDGSTLRQTRGEGGTETRPVNVGMIPVIFF